MAVRQAGAAEIEMMARNRLQLTLVIVAGWTLNRADVLAWVEQQQDVKVAR